VMFVCMWLHDVIIIMIGLIFIWLDDVCNYMNVNVFDLCAEVCKLLILNIGLCWNEYALILDIII